MSENEECEHDIALAYTDSRPNLDIIVQWA